MPPSSAETCPICGKPSSTGRPRPFCSPRCADVDLGRWFTGVYAVPVRPEEDDDAAPLDPGGAIR